MRKPVKKLAPKKAVKAVKSSVGKKRLLTDMQIEKLKKMHASGKHLVADLCSKFNISVPTLYNYLKRK